MNISDGLTFDDVLLVPQYSEVISRSKVDLKVSFYPWSSQYFQHPIIPANMKTVMSLEVADQIIKSGGLAILHRFSSLEDQLNTVKQLFSKHVSAPQHLAISIGVKEEDKANLAEFIKLDIKNVCIDIAHGDSIQCIDMIRWIRDQYPDLLIIAGNVATANGAERLWKAGANVVKVGVGPGSLCTTRIETGNGVPQLTALMDVNEVRIKLQDKYPGDKFSIIADGGIKSAGDIVKSLCFADMVMVGNLFAGCLESPGTIVNVDGRTYKEYAGSSTHKTNHVEGVVALVPTKGHFSEILTKLLEGLRSGCSYQGVENLADLKDSPQFVRITGAGLRESHPHDVIL
jgi:IMP dehydrogenase